jgi:hypothetical protein
VGVARGFEGGRLRGFRLPKSSAPQMLLRRARSRTPDVQSPEGTELFGVLLVLDDLALRLPIHFRSVPGSRTNPLERCLFQGASRVAWSRPGPGPLVKPVPRVSNGAPRRSSHGQAQRARGAAGEQHGQEGEAEHLCRSGLAGAPSTPFCFALWLLL